MFDIPRLVSEVTALLILPVGLTMKFIHQTEEERGERREPGVMLNNTHQGQPARWSTLQSWLRPAIPGDISYLLEKIENSPHLKAQCNMPRCQATKVHS